MRAHDRFILTRSSLRSSTRISEQKRDCVRFINGTTYSANGNDSVLLFLREFLKHTLIAKYIYIMAFLLNAVSEAKNLDFNDWVGMYR